jgi:NAD(P)-dependent dehydrogenase (short-subunit alcohol dehydrogenase family)
VQVASGAVGLTGSAEKLGPTSDGITVAKILEAMTITLITGANKGLGRETARRLLEAGHTVLLGARGAGRGTQAANELGAVFVEIDPMSETSVTAAAAEVHR